MSHATWPSKKDESRPLELPVGKLLGMFERGVLAAKQGWSPSGRDENRPPHSKAAPKRADVNCSRSDRGSVQNQTHGRWTFPALGGLTLSPSGSLLSPRQLQS